MNPKLALQLSRSLREARGRVRELEKQRDALLTTVDILTAERDALQSKLFDLEMEALEEYPDGGTT